MKKKFSIEEKIDSLNKLWELAFNWNVDNLREFRKVHKRITLLEKQLRKSK